MLSDEDKATIQGLLEAAIAGKESTIRSRKDFGLHFQDEQEWRDKYRQALAALTELRQLPAMELERVPTGEYSFDSRMYGEIRWRVFEDGFFQIYYPGETIIYRQLPAGWQLWRPRQEVSDAA